MLDVERHIEGEPLASRPIVVFPLDDRRIGISRVAGKFQHRGPPSFLIFSPPPMPFGPNARATSFYGGPAGFRFFRGPGQSDRPGRSRRCAFSAKRWVYSPTPSDSSQFTICRIATHLCRCDTFQDCLNPQSSLAVLGSNNPSL